jgi:hypothetical protein
MNKGKFGEAFNNKILPNLKNTNLLLLLLIPSYFLMDGINKFRYLIPASSGVKILVVCVTASCLFHYILQKRIDKSKSILVSSFMLFCYLFFIPILSLFTKIKPLPVFNSPGFYLPFFGLLSFLFFLLVYKISIKPLKHFILYLRILFAVLLFGELVKYAFITGRQPRYEIITDKLNTHTVLQKARPNIYLFVLDEYAGLSSLKTYFHFSNLDFIDSLKKRNFFIAKNPNSNYNMTWISMLSCLEMSYVKNLDKNEFSHVRIYGNAAEDIKENNLITFFSKLNYKIVNNTFFKLNHTKSSPFLTLPIERRLLLNKTFGYTVQNGLLQNIPSNQIQFLMNTQLAKNHKYNESVIEKTRENINNKEAPVFLYSHLLMPHLPYLKDQYGNTRKFSSVYKELRKKEYSQSYINYLEHTNNLMLEFSDSIIQKKKDAVIIIMSDHGYRWDHGKRIPILDFNNFMAIYSTRGDYRNFSDSINTVNLFRIVLNNYFDQKIPLLENKFVDIRAGHL